MRSIPACAGETAPPALRPVRRGVDPRVRGGDNTLLATSPFSAGRSPRARGRLLASVTVILTGRSIPACAGETTKLYGCMQDFRVDPRVRGGDPRNSAQSSSSKGRSPRARGRPLEYDLSCGRVGSIPACAGETGQVAVRRQHFRVDPRVRGGDIRESVFHAGFQGRSPRARGRHCLKIFGKRPGGSIPACAGETGAISRHLTRRQVDPRVRGGDALCTLL